MKKYILFAVPIILFAVLLPAALFAARSRFYTTPDPYLCLDAYNPARGGQQMTNNIVAQTFTAEKDMVIGWVKIGAFRSNSLTPTAIPGISVNVKVVTPASMYSKDFWATTVPQQPINWITPTKLPVMSRAGSDFVGSPGQYSFDCVYDPTSQMVRIFPPLEVTAGQMVAIFLQSDAPSEGNANIIIFPDQTVQPKSYARGNAWYCSGQSNLVCTNPTVTNFAPTPLPQDYAIAVYAEDTVFATPTVAVSIPEAEGGIEGIVGGIGGLFGLDAIASLLIFVAVITGGAAAFTKSASFAVLTGGLLLIALSTIFMPLWVTVLCGIVVIAAVLTLRNGRQSEIAE